MNQVPLYKVGDVVVVRPLGSVTTISAMDLSGHVGIVTDVSPGWDQRGQILGLDIENRLKGHSGLFADEVVLINSRTTNSITITIPGAMKKLISDKDIEVLLPTLNVPSEKCQHQWKVYTGLNFSDEHCTICKTIRPLRNT